MPDLESYYRDDPAQDRTGMERQSTLSSLANMGLTMVGVGALMLVSRGTTALISRGTVRALARLAPDINKAATAMGRHTTFRTIGRAAAKRAQSSGWVRGAGAFASESASAIFGGARVRMPLHVGSALRASAARGEGLGGVARRLSPELDSIATGIDRRIAYYSSLKGAHKGVSNFRVDRRFREGATLNWLKRTVTSLPSFYVAERAFGLLDRSISPEHLTLAKWTGTVVGFDLAMSAAGAMFGQAKASTFRRLSRMTRTLSGAGLSRVAQNVADGLTSRLATAYTVGGSFHKSYIESLRRTEKAISGIGTGLKDGNFRGSKDALHSLKDVYREMRRSAASGLRGAAHRDAMRDLTGPTALLSAIDTATALMLASRRAPKTAAIADPALRGKHTGQVNMLAILEEYKHRPRTPFLARVLGLKPVRLRDIPEDATGRFRRFREEVLGRGRRLLHDDALRVLREGKLYLGPGLYKTPGGNLVDLRNLSIRRAAGHFTTVLHDTIKVPIPFSGGQKVPLLGLFHARALLGETPPAQPITGAVASLIPMKWMDISLSDRLHSMHSDSMFMAIKGLKDRKAKLYHLTETGITPEDRASGIKAVFRQATKPDAPLAVVQASMQGRLAKIMRLVSARALAKDRAFALPTGEAEALADAVYPSMYMHGRGKQVLEGASKLRQQWHQFRHSTQFLMQESSTILGRMAQPLNKGSYRRILGLFSSKTSEPLTTKSDPRKISEYLGKLHNIVDREYAGGLHAILKHPDILTHFLQSATWGGAPHHSVQALLERTAPLRSMVRWGTEESRGRISRSTGKEKTTARTLLKFFSRIGAEIDATRDINYMSRTAKGNFTNREQILLHLLELGGVDFRQVSSNTALTHTVRDKVTQLTRTGALNKKDASRVAELLSGKPQGIHELMDRAMDLSNVQAAGGKGPSLMSIPQLVATAYGMTGGADTKFRRVAINRIDSLLRDLKLTTNQEYYKTLKERVGLFEGNRIGTYSRLPTTPMTRLEGQHLVVPRDAGMLAKVLYYSILDKVNLTASYIGGGWDWGAVAQMRGGAMSLMGARALSFAAGTFMWRTLDTAADICPILDQTGLGEGINVWGAERSVDARLAAAKVYDIAGVTGTAKYLEGLMPMSTSFLPGAGVGGIIAAGMKKGPMGIAAGTLIGGFTNRALNTVFKESVLAGLAIVPPFAPVVADLTLTADDVKDYYSGRRPVPYRHGRYWELSGTQLKGGRITGWIPSWFARMKADAEATEYGFGSKLAKYWYQDLPMVGAAPGDLLDPYFMESRHLHDRPYPMCFHPETPVLTLDGFKEIQSIDDNDLVLNKDGVWTKALVKASRPCTEGELVEITIAGDNRKLRVTPDHPVLCLRNNYTKSKNGGGDKCRHKKEAIEYGTLEWVTAKDIKRHDFVVLPVVHSSEEPVTYDLASITGWAHTDSEVMVCRSNQALVDAYALVKAGVPLIKAATHHNVSYSALKHLKYRNGPKRTFPRHIKLDENLAYLFGFYLTEGYIDITSGARVTFCLSAKETRYAEDISTIVQDKFGITPTLQKRGNALYVKVGSTALTKLIEHVFGRHKAPSKVIPECVFSWPEDIRKALIRAMIRGDGCIQPRSVEYSSASSALAMSLRRLLLGLGIGCSFRVDHMRSHARKDGVIIRDSFSHTVHITGKDVNRFAEFEEEVTPITSPGASKRGVISENYYYVPVRKVEVIPYTGLVFDLTVKEKSSFLTTCIVHNSGGLFFDVPMVGPLLAATVGSLIKPPKYLVDIEEEIGEPGFGGTVSPFRPTEGAGPNLPLLQSPFGVRSIAAEMFYRNIIEAPGLQGYIIEQTVGNPFEDPFETPESLVAQTGIAANYSTLASSRTLDSSVHRYWEMQLGGMLGLCFVPDTKIKTDKGTLCIEDVEIGHKVLTHGEYRLVIDKSVRHSNEKLFEIEVRSAGIKLQCSLNHRIPVLRRHRYKSGRIKPWKESNYDIVETQAKDIQKGDYLFYEADEIEKRVASDWHFIDRACLVAVTNVRVTEHYNGPLYDLTIEGKHYYTAEGIRVHNSEAVRRLYPRITDEGWNPLTNEMGSWLPASLRSGDPFCCAPWCPVEIDGSLKPAAEVRAGDKVTTHTGQVSEISQVMTRNVDEDLVVLSLKGLPWKLSITAEHPLFTKDGWTLAGGLHTGDTVLYPLQTTTDPGWTTMLARALGVVRMLGHCGKTNITFGVKYLPTSAEHAIILGIQEPKASKKRGYVERGASYAPQHGCDPYRAVRANDIGRRSKSFVAFCKQQLRPGHLMDGNHLRSTPEHLTSYLAGMFLDPGIPLLDDKIPATSLASIAYGLWVTFSRIGFHPDLEKRGKYYYLSFSSDETEQIHKFIEGGVVPNVPPPEDYASITIEHVERKHYRGKVFAFSVERDESFCLAGVASHNSQIPFGTFRLPGAPYEATHHVEITFPVGAAKLGAPVHEIAQHMLGLTSPFDDKTEDVLETGTKMHAIVQQQLAEHGLLLAAEKLVYDPEHEVHSFVDAIIRGPSGKPEVLEIKTVNANRYAEVIQEGQAFWNHYVQTNFYMHELGTPTGSILYINRDDPEQMTSVQVHYAQDVYKKSIANLMDARSAAKEAYLGEGLGLSTRAYSWFDRYKILADVAPVSEEYFTAKDIVTKQAELALLTPEQTEELPLVEKRRKLQMQRFEFHPIRFDLKGVLNPSETIDIQTYNENIKAASEYSLPARIAGSLWSKFASLRIPWVSGKLLPLYNPIEQYDRYVLYGDPYTSFTLDPFELADQAAMKMEGASNPFQGALSSLLPGYLLGSWQVYATLGAAQGTVEGLRRAIGGAPKIREDVKDRRELHRYLDRITYSRNQMLHAMTGDPQYKIAAQNTLVSMRASNMYPEDPAVTARSLSFEEKPFLTAFTDIDPRYRQDVLERVSTEMGEVLQHYWERKDTAWANPTSKEASRTRQNPYVQGLGYDKGFGTPWMGMGAEQQREPRGAGEAAMAAANVLSTQAERPLPGAAWGGYAEEAPTDIYKMVTVENVGADAHAFGTGWEPQRRLAATLQPVPAQEAVTGMSPEQYLLAISILRSTVDRLVAKMGGRASVNIIHDGNDHHTLELTLVHSSSAGVQRGILGLEDRGVL